MDFLDLIETPENVELERRLAGIGSRFIAGLLDHLILLLVFISLVLTLYLSAPDPRLEGVGVLAYAVLIVLAFLLFWGYFVYFEYRTNGQSPGKKALRIRVVKEGGTPMTFTDIAVRNVLRVVDCLPPPVYGVAGIAMFIAGKCQRLGDLAAGTVVVSEQLPDYSAHSDRRLKANWEAGAGAAALRATGLTPEEYRVLNSYWMRRTQLTLEARQTILPSLLAPVLQRTGQRLADGRFETLEAYVQLLMQQAWFAERQGQTPTDPAS
ncbi:MAG: RDD family protein [Verrucomicrobia bacterium]|nr:RDD family protein [Verrucomicrobiota bacterium]